MVSSALLPAASRSPTGRVTPASSLAAIVTNALFVDNPETLGLMSESRHFEPDPPLTKQAEERVGVLSRLKNVWHRYVDSKRQFMSIAERCSNRGWPDRKMEIRLQVTGVVLRSGDAAFWTLVETWRASTNWAYKSLTSVSAISKATGEEWTEVAERAARRPRPTVTEGMT
jgi:hypothetical protein